MSYTNPADHTVFHLINEYPAAPAPGAPYQLVLPDRYRHEILSVAFQLITDATVANRFAEVRLVGPIRNLALSLTPAAHTASAAYWYWFHRRTPQPLAAGFLNGNFFIPLFADAILVGQGLLQISATNLQAGDQISDIAIIRRVWHQPTFPT